MATRLRKIIVALLVCSVVNFIIMVNVILRSGQIGILSQQGQFIYKRTTRSAQATQTTTATPTYEEAWHLAKNLTAILRENPNFFAIEPELACSSIGGETLKLLIVVASKPESVEARTTIRETWAKDVGKDDGLVLFLLGRSRNPDAQEAVVKENAQNRDLLQVDLRDKASSSTQKLVSLMYWVRHNCAGAMYVLKIDEKTLVLPGNLAKFLEVAPKTGFAGGRPLLDTRPVRNKQSVWYIPESVWPDSRYPPYLEGSAFLLSMDVILRASDLFQKLVFFPFEDVYLGVILEALELNLTHVNNFDIHGTYRRICQVKSLLLSTKFEPRQMRSYWKSLNADLETKCDTRDPYLEKLRVQQNNGELKGRIFNDFSYQFIVNPRSRCVPDFPDEEDIRDVFLLIITPSRPQNLKQRDVIRNTRGTRKFMLGQKIVQLFLIGKTFNKKTDAAVAEESLKHDDVVIVDMHDNYNNMTLKTAMMFKWASVNCPNAKYVMKSDDDVFVHLHNLVITLVDQSRSRLVLAYVHRKTWPLRDRKYKWYVSEEEWPLEEPYPPYPNGPAYVMSYDVATDVYMSSYTTELFRFEDVYVGINLQKLGIYSTHNKGFDSFGKRRTICELKESLASHYVPEDLMYKFWRQTEEWGEFVPCKQDDVTPTYRNINGIIIDNGKAIGLKNITSSEKSNNLLINHKEKCSERTNHPFLLISVFSQLANTKLRAAIRETWGMHNQEVLGVRVETLFFVGVDINNVETQVAIKNEDEIYGDIIQSNFIESYEHEVLKTLTMLHWTSRFCAGAGFLVKVDDDAFLNVRNMIGFLKAWPTNELYLGNVRLNAAADRSETSKWYTPVEVWDRTTYPPYVGNAYVLSLSVVQMAVRATFEMPVFKWEDVYIGILLEKLGVYPYPHIHFDLTGAYRSNCALQSSMVSSHFSAEMTRKYWKILQSGATDGDDCQISSLGKLKPNFGDGEVVLSSEQCSTDDADANSPFLVMLVFTPPDQLENRNAARLTWARRNTVLGKRVEVRFVVGKSSDKGIRTIIQNEAKIHPDIIISEATESVDNSTLKQISALHWVHSICPFTKFVMIVPAESFVNIDNVVTYLLHAPQTHHMTCHLKRNTKPIRSVDSQWYVSKDDWPLDYFPPHCNDKTASIMSMDVVKEILYHSHNQKLVKFPDVHIGMILQTHLKNVRLSHNTAFDIKGTAHRLQDGGADDICGLDSVMVTNDFTGQLMQYVVKQILEGNFAKCSAQRRKEISDTNSQMKSNREKSRNIQYELMAKFANETAVNKHDIPLIIDHPERCRRHRKGVFLLIIVRTEPGHKSYRNAIRATWSKESSVEGVVVEHIFLVGRPKDPKLQEEIWTEDEMNEDIVQGDFVDVFANQTVKTLMALQWASQRCPDVKYAMITQSITFVHVSNLILYLKTSFAQENDLVVGHILKDSKPVRNAKSMFYVPVEVYPEEAYPPYPEGRGYLMSGDVVHKTYVTSQYTDLFPWEDVYVGMLLRKLSITPRAHSDFISESLKEVPDVCYMRNAFTWNVVGSEAIGASYQKLQHSQNISCFEEDQIKPDLYDFKVTSEQVCKRQSGNVNLLIAVVTSPYNFGRRRAIRETWGMHYENLTDFDVTTVFMLGMTRDAETSFMLQEESAYYRDIVQINFVDSYRNLTLKTVMLLKWVATYCPNTNFVMKVDDDVFVNIRNVATALREAPTTGYSWGRTFFYQWPVRDPKHKNYTPRDLWPDRFFPPYNSGPCYVMSADVVKDAYKASFGAKRFLNEDVFMGILQQNVGVNPQRDVRFDIGGDARDLCALRQIIATHKVMARDMYKFWYWLDAHKDVNCTEDNLPDRHFGLYYQNQTSWQEKKYAFHMANQQFCSKSLTSLVGKAKKSVLVMVSSQTGNFEARAAIRDTWGRFHDNDNAIMSTLFFVGETANHTEQVLLRKESSFHGDIVQTNVPGYHHYATFKTIASFLWLDDYCGDFDFVIKTDDGTFLNSQMFLRYFKTKAPPTSNFVAGSVIAASRPVRDARSPYYTPEEVWPREQFPLYVETPTYILSMDVAKRLNSVARTTQPTIWEDVFVGLLLQKLNIWKPVAVTGLDFKGTKRVTCEYSSSLATAFFTPNQMRTFWQEFNADTVCSDL